MRKVIAVVCVVALCCTLVPASAPAAPSSREPGGFVSFLVGCCWGLRVGTEFNEGRNLHWREWVPYACAIVPYIGSVAMGVFKIWDGVQCAKGMTTKEFAEKYGANWY